MRDLFDSYKRLKPVEISTHKSISRNNYVVRKGTYNVHIDAFATALIEIDN